MREWRKWVLPAVSCAALAIALIALAGNLTGKIAVVDLNKLMEDSSKAKSYEKQLANKYQQLTANLDSEKLSESEKEKKQAAAYDEYLKTKNELEQKLEREVAASVSKVARRRRLSVVLYKEAVRWGGMDITSEAIRALK